MGKVVDGSCSESNYLWCLAAIHRRSWLSISLCVFGDCVFRPEGPLCAQSLARSNDSGCSGVKFLLYPSGRLHSAECSRISADDGLLERKIGQRERRREESKGGEQENREAVAEGQAGIPGHPPSSSIRSFSYLCHGLCVKFVFVGVWARKILARFVMQLLLMLLDGLMMCFMSSFWCLGFFFGLSIGSEF